MSDGPQPCTHATCSETVSWGNRTRTWRLSERHISLGSCAFWMCSMNSAALLTPSFRISMPASLSLELWLILSVPQEDYCHEGASFSNDLRPGASVMRQAEG